MKPSSLFTLSILLSLISSECLAQLTAEAGNDTAVCADNPNSLTIGGNPTAKGGVPPYKYTWSGSYRYAGRIYTASFMLEDTTIANPVFRKGAIPDSVVLNVTVTDHNDDVAIDSIEVRRSNYLACLGECRKYINEGDSVQLGHCVTGGIPPIQYLWTPTETLSDSTIRNPWAKPSFNTTYTLQIIDSIGCQTNSYCRVFVNPAGYDYLSSNPEIEVYPNPSSKTLIRTRGSQNLEDAIFHSDGGGQYYCKEFIALTKKLKMRNSMTQEDVYENAHSERLNGIIKNDYLYPYHPNDRPALKKGLKKAVWMYNNEEPHSSLNNLTPVRYRTQNAVDNENISSRYFPLPTAHHHHIEKEKRKSNV